MQIGLLYFVVILLANSLGAVSGMGGGVIIKPVFDLIGAHSVAAISFYSATAVFTMSAVSTLRQVRSGVKIEGRMLLGIALGALGGGWAGNAALNWLLRVCQNEGTVKLIQIVITIVTLLFALLYTRNDWQGAHLAAFGWYLACGALLGFFASLLGIGGGPINVSLLMLMFGMPIKLATVYSIGTIFFSQLSKLVSIALTGQLLTFDLGILAFVIPSAILGGLIGAHLSHLLSPRYVTIVFQAMILFVIVINLYNGVMLCV
ncbi:sulfite exporter TauE/SafE family protein [Lacticaseibacillus daqingensis]|uniref:sulfite exporter TauE/SafE family protein n=1 Tax=Lacticaseibacillus daqingensis TaxID=2486014 RepID=UPI000F7A390C|nr:sulfite exporter TauE/SafE family protein [Lacticaseibacillus daqingensis]